MVLSLKFFRNNGPYTNYPWFTNNPGSRGLTNFRGTFFYKFFNIFVKYFFFMFPIVTLAWLVASDFYTNVKRQSYFGNSGFCWTFHTKSSKSIKNQQSENKARDLSVTFRHNFQQFITWIWPSSCQLGWKDSSRVTLKQVLWKVLRMSQGVWAIFCHSWLIRL